MRVVALLGAAGLLACLLPLLTSSVHEEVVATMLLGHLRTERLVLLIGIASRLLARLIEDA